MNTRIMAVMFDHGRVLSRGGEKGTNERVAAELMGLNEPIEVPDLSDALKRGHIHNATFVNEVNKRYAGQAQRELTLKMWDRVHQLIKPDQQAYAFARKCREAGLRVGILSNISSGMAVRFDADGSYLGFYPLALSCYTGYAKPEQESSALVEARLPGIAPEEILFLDDQEVCVQAARERGWQGIVVTSSDQMIREASKLLGFK